MKKKKGYTIIELMAVITILSVIILSSNNIINYYNKSIRDIEVENFLISTVNLLTYGKARAIKDNSKLQINFNEANKKVMLIKEYDVIKSFKIPNYIKVTNGMIIDITTDGQISSQTTQFKNTKENETYFLKVRVGVDYIKIEKAKR